MKCYYEVLGVPRDVNGEDLKKSYRKLALKWHPDKNIDNATEAKEQFQLVQQAYEVLSDPQERSWYDSHRESILKGAGSDYKDNSLDVFQYFTPSCFKGYDDDEKGFYAVYREVFNKLAAEDSEYMTEEDSDFEVPNFGDSKSSYEDIVHPFYACWQSYSTKKSYAWLDPYDIRDAPNRRVVRAAEKENKKVRDKARKQRNEEVRNLVLFVRKRDKRVQTYVKLLEERAAENVKKAEERRKKHLRERQEEMKNYKESEWTKFSNIEKQLEAIEANLVEEFGESQVSSHGESESDGEDVEAPVNLLYCVACNKVFKTEKAFSNHENSKKHKENVDVLKTSVEDEEVALAESGENQKTEEDSINDSLEVNSTNGITSDSNLSLDGDLDESEPVEKILRKKNKKQNKNRVSNICVISDEETSDIDYQVPSGQSKKQRKKQRKKVQVQPSAASDSGTEDIDSRSDIKSNDSVVTDDPVKLTDTSAKKVKGKKAKDTKKEKRGDPSKEDQVNNAEEVEGEMKEEDKVEDAKGKNRRIKELKKKSKKDGSEGADNVRDLNHCCVTCQSEFPSKNKLFDHLKKTGHSVFIPRSSGTVTEEKVDKKGKGKAKKCR